MRTPGCIAITGLDTFLGRRLAMRLLERAEPPEIIGIDLRPVRALTGSVRERPVDLTDPKAESELTGVLLEDSVDALVHLAFRSDPSPYVEADHALEVTGSLHVQAACVAAKVRRLVVASSTMLYGARPTNPNFLDESSALYGHPGAHCVQNRVEVEHELVRFAERNRDLDVTVLRSCWIVGPTCKDPFVRHVDRKVVPVPLGHDPLLQLIHEDDIVTLLERAVLERHPGVFNAVGRGVLPLSTLLALGGKRPLPLPKSLLQISLPQHHARTGDSPDGFLDYLRYLWVASGERAWREFGEPAYSTREAWMSFISSRRMRQYV